MSPELSHLLPYGTEVQAALQLWVPEQRWYGSKGRDADLRIVAATELTDREPGLVIRVLLVQSDLPDGTVELHQVPLVFRREKSSDSGLIATIGQAPDQWYLYDGPHDVAYCAALLRAVYDSTDVGGAGLVVSARRLADAGRAPESITGEVLKGEQSNTSIIYRLRDATNNELSPLICKVFRRLHAGDNPDVVLQSGLWEAHCDRVPRPVGYLRGQWTQPESATADSAASGAPGALAVEEPRLVTGHLAFVQEFLPGVEDAWRVASRAVESGTDFTAEAFALGVATAQVHSTLAECFATIDADRAIIESVLASITRRRQQAEALAPQLLEVAPQIDAILASASGTQWPILQRIHGDYHLGQVLRASERGWILVDFEGEPARPMIERSEPDLALRDIAGMLRSFDYAVGSHYHRTPVAGRNRDSIKPGESGASSWAAAAREAFLDGYHESSGFDPRSHPLLQVLVLDKALYEVVYEARNRPDWLPIPLAQIIDLTAGFTARTDSHEEIE
jgi:maltokinase